MYPHGIIVSITYASVVGAEYMLTGVLLELINCRRKEGVEPVVVTTPSMAVVLAVEITMGEEGRVGMTMGVGMNMWEEYIALMSAIVVEAEIGEDERSASTTTIVAVLAGEMGQVLALVVFLLEMWAAE